MGIQSIIITPLFLQYCISKISIPNHKLSVMLEINSYLYIFRKNHEYEILVF